MEVRYFSEKLAGWYGQHKRNLPWRDTTDPYKIWLSEVILQQTRVAQGLPYYERFIRAYPTVGKLAAAPEQDVLRLWQGLGYYSRARNLHKCAKEVVTNFKGVFPSTYAELIGLPGIGDYTAAAVASFCSKEPVAVVDGNVYRVLSRVFGIDNDVNSPEGKKVFKERASRVLNQAASDLHNQALMEFGALWCTPKKPKCDDCIFRASCVAANGNIQHLLPVKTRPKKARNRYFYYFVLRKGKALMMKKRNQKDIWNGLYDFYLVETQKEINPQLIIREDAFLKEAASASESISTSSPYKHLLSHQTIISRFTVIDGVGSHVAEQPLKYYPVKKIHDLPKPVLISRFLEDYDFL